MKQDKRSFTAVISREDAWWVGFIIEIAGVNCQARTRKELLANLRSALKEALEIRRALSLALASEDYEEQTVVV
ncbi:MAG TPA: type II toxin-antitoxin system HicB family antitoxin [Verrucomicrobiae bacterium]|nr:type II toxin-antitoxin system HicB family antitoxin [Verrucomicrobiae bacterium]